MHSLCFLLAEQLASAMAEVADMPETEAADMPDGRTSRPD